MSNESEPVQAVSCLRNQSDTRHEVTLSSFTSASVMTLNTQMCNSTSRIHVGRTFMKTTFTVVYVEASRFFRFRFYVETTQCSGRVQAPKPPGKHHVLTLNTDPVTRVTVSSVSFSKTTDTFKMHISLFCNFTFLLGWIFYFSLITTLRWSSGEVQETSRFRLKYLNVSKRPEYIRWCNWNCSQSFGCKNTVLTTSWRESQLIII